MMKSKIAAGVGLALCGALFFAEAADVTVEVRATLIQPGCVINNNAAEIVDFGTFPTNSIRLGAPPSQPGLIQTVSMPITCVDMGTPVTLRMNAVPSAENPALIETGKPGLGVAISTQSDVADSAYWILPNTGTLSVPLQSGQGTVLFYAAPIGTGVLPEPGTFTAQAVLNVEYP
ncbi:fimbrial protein [Aeromonas aquatica]|uniref:fimbrial protein n=1 Tax=Aeromonas aquatica TaxID=558964 RepID=UPI00286F49A5|nr:fimbrial protein [Aeromonas aquatica]